MDMSVTDRNPDPGDNPLLFRKIPRGVFKCMKTMKFCNHQAFEKSVYFTVILVYVHTEAILTGTEPGIF